MPKAKIGDINLNYTVQGSGDWLVMVGGFVSGNWQAWGPQLDEMAKHFKVLAFDNRGIGASDAPDYPYTTEMLALDAVGLMKHLEIDKAHVFGKSLGGAIAQWITLLEPSRVRSLVMTSTFGRMGPRSQDIVRWWLGSAQAMGLNRCFFEGMLSYFYSEAYYEANREAIDSTIDKLLQVQRPLHGYLNTGNALLTHDVMNRLGDIRCPTKILIGDKDLITTIEHSVELGRLIPNSEVAVFEKTLHGFMSERPDAFESIVDFFGRH